MKHETKKIIIGLAIAIAVYFFFKATIKSKDEVVESNTIITDSARRADSLTSAKQMAENEERIKHYRDTVKPQTYDENTYKNKQPPATSEDSQYTTLITFKGNGRRKSKIFHLSGNDAKIVFKYTSMVEEVGVFDLYIVNKGSNAVADGLAPELTITKSHDSGESSIQKPEGDYFLDITAAGDWSIKIEELQ